MTLWHKPAEFEGASTSSRSGMEWDSHESRRFIVTGDTKTHSLCLYAFY